MWGQGGQPSGGRGGDRFDAGLEGVADQVGVPAGAGLVADPVQVRSDRVDRQEQAELIDRGHRVAVYASALEYAGT